MKLASSSSLFSGLPVRDLIRQIKLKTTDIDIQIALSLFLGTTEKTQQARKRSHLTHATEINHQIRFALKDRVERSIAKLAATCARQLKKNSISNISVDIHSNDFPSQIFFNHLQEMGVNLGRHPAQLKTENPNELLTTTEKEILKALNRSPQDLSLLLNTARERIYTGDYATAYTLLMHVPSAERTDTVHYILGLCCNFFGNTTASEIHFRQFLASENILSKVKATYVLSMLYLRLHPKEKQNLETAEHFLSEGHRLIESHPTVKDYVFHSVFNRNGFALCLFRRGKIQEALSLLSSGLQRLQQSDDGARHLHRSVLIFNAVQCLKALKRYPECEDLCQDLLKIDPLFPEYLLELATVYLEQSKFEAALATLKKAEDLDAFIPEIYALRGYAYLNQDRTELATKNYRKAVKLAPRNLIFQSDLSYCLEIRSQPYLENTL